jgi:putative MATE family efflux protein
VADRPDRTRREPDVPTAADPHAADDPEGSPALPSASLGVAAGADAVQAPAEGPGEGYTDIWRLAWPVTLNLAVVNVVSLIDIAMLGRLGASAMAAAGYTQQFHFLSSSVLFAVGFACVALMSRSIGSGNLSRARHALAASLLVSLGAAVAIVLVIALPAPTWLKLLGADPEVVTLTIPYLNLVLGSTIPLAIAMTFEFGLRADQDTRTPLLIAVTVSAAKTLGNLLLIFGWLGFPRLELVGAGIATLLSQVLGLACFGVVIWRRRAPSPLALGLRDFSASAPLLRDVVRLSLPGLGERLAMNLALLAYFRILADYGTAAIAAYTVGIRVLSFSWLPGSGFGVAASTLVGQALGGGDPEAASRVGWRALRLAVGVALVLGIPCALARTHLARLFVEDAGTVAALEPFLLCLALAQPFLQAHFALGGAHRGAGDTITPFFAAAAGNWALRLPLACLFAYVWQLPLVWVWYALLFDHVTRTAWLAWSFQRGRWRHARA